MKSNSVLPFLYCLLFSHIISAQFTLPYSLINNSIYDDAEIYVGLVGKFGNNVDVWMDMNDYSLVPMSAEQNSLDGPEWSTPTDWKYPDIFTKLSAITDNTLQIPQGLYGCRIFISFESPMYLHFHETGGYAGANLNTSSDPNDGIRWELVELTWGDSGLWTNSSRVDAYQYPISVEVSGFTGGLSKPTYTESYLSALGGNGSPKYGKIGEKLPHEEILSKWDETVSSDYLQAKLTKEHSIDGGYIIEQPSKVEGFPEGVLDSYIDEIWETYRENDLLIDIGDRAIWTGRVSGDQFNFTDPADGSIATIYGKPTSFNAIEGSGFLAFTEVSASDNQEKHDEDLMIQAQMAAAINRHAIYTDIIDGSVQYTHDDSRYFLIEPYNEYVSFFHNEEISYESQTYAFAYDDVGDHSSTLQCTYPTGVRVIIGGYDQYVDPDPVLTLITISPYVTEMEEGSSLQLMAQAYDQFSNPFPSDITWTLTGDGSLDENGLLTANSAGVLAITAQDGMVSRSIVIQVTEQPGLTGCEAFSPNGQYSYIATDEPTLTFIPGLEGIGEPVCILYYKIGENGQLRDAVSSPNTPRQINALEGDSVYFYYTYSLANGGENNTSSTLQSFVVGECKITSSTTPSYSELANLHLAPNPTNGMSTKLSGFNEDAYIEVYTSNGILINSHKVKKDQSFNINTSALTPNLYLLRIRSIDGHHLKTLKLIVN